MKEIVPDRFPLDMDEREWRPRRIAQLEGTGLTGEEIFRRLARDFRARLDARERAQGEREERTRRAREEMEARRVRRRGASHEQMVEHLARRIAAERAYARIPQRKLAEAIGVSQPAMSRIERGRRAVTGAELIRIAEALGRPLEAFAPWP